MYIKSQHLIENHFLVFISASVQFAQTGKAARCYIHQLVNFHRMRPFYGNEGIMSKASSVYGNTSANG